MVPVVRAELVTRDMEVIAELISHLWAERRARFRCGNICASPAVVRSCFPPDRPARRQCAMPGTR
jgi:hypothetical protein